MEEEGRDRKSKCLTGQANNTRRTESTRVCTAAFALLDWLHKLHRCEHHLNFSEVDKKPSHKYFSQNELPSKLVP